VVHKVTAQGVLVAACRTPNTGSLRLDEVGIEEEREGVTVDHRNRTPVPTVDAVGDITGRANFTHSAAYDSVLAVRDNVLSWSSNRSSIDPLVHVHRSRGRPCGPH
jgi:pyruvate/2-oxoglutarate dehydrogenase complex dihydrolipoamide dehydrogenase (E3) component